MTTLKKQGCSNLLISSFVPGPISCCISTRNRAWHQNVVRVLGNKGNEFTEDNIGSAVSHRELMQNLRHMGETKGGPAPMNKTDRSAFLGKLDQIIQNIKRKNKIP